MPLRNKYKDNNIQYIFIIVFYKKFTVFIYYYLFSLLLSLLLSSDFLKILQDSPLKNWCEELDLKNFADVDAWINDVKQKRKVLILNKL